MAITSVDSFVRIFKFYQANPIVKKEKRIDPSTGKIKNVNVTLASKFRQNSLIYEDTIDVYLHSLVLDKYHQLSYDKDADTIQVALNAREKLSKYFTKVLFPGSYAYSTVDNASIRRMLLDWSSTIKTIQDANRRVTNAYSLSSDDVDKALRGFGIDFVNNNSLKSIDRRKNFLLNVCDLYSIKGTPDSIVRALNIIGLEDIFIREAWLCKDVEKYNGDYDLRMRWEAQKSGQKFDEVNRTYIDLDTHDDMYTTWDWFEEKIHGDEDVSTFDPHWFYTKNEIKNINNDSEVYMKLPSITPYFGIEYVSDLDRNIDSFEILFNEINKQFQNHLLNNSAKKTIWLDTFPDRLSALECYTGLIYSLIRLDEHVQYENFKAFLESNKFKIPEFETPYEYLNLIHWMFENRKTIFSSSYEKLLNDYIPLKSNNYCSYENVLRWWIEKPASDLERKGTYDESTETWSNPSITDPLIILPTRSNTSASFADYIELEWDNIYPFGRYCIEEYSEPYVDEHGHKSGGWTEVVTNGYIYQNHMKAVVKTDWADFGSENLDNFRVVVYHHNNNIPSIFFNSPFNFNASPTNTMFDRVMRYNGVAITLDYYKDDPIQQSFINQQTQNKTSAYSIISGYHESEALNSKIRTTEIHDDMMTYYSHAFNYPSKSKLYEDKWMNINASFYDYVEWSIKDYYDTATHNGLLESNLVENKKWPLNKRWNWAVDSKYFYINYQSNKWMRCEHQGVTERNPTNNSSIRNYGERFFIDNKLYVCVAVNKWIVIDHPGYVETNWETRGCDLLPNGKIKAGSKLCRDLTIGMIKNTDVLSLMEKNSILTDKSSDEYRENIRELNQAIIEVYTEPHGNSLVSTTSYSYDNFLTWLYNSRLTLDFSTGYIYPLYEGYIDDHNRVYLKCRNESNSIVWIRFNNKRDNIEWNSCDAVSIYDNNTNMGVLLPSYSLPNRYDSLRVLDGKIYNYRKELLKDFKEGKIDDSINLVIIRPYRTTTGEFEETESQYMNDTPVVYQKVPYVTLQGSLEINYTWEKCESNRFHDCLMGVNSDLVDWIEAQIASENQNYIELPNIFADSLNKYLINDLGIDGSLLDLIISSWANSGIVKKIINYYKPKRARLLFISNVLEGNYSLSNGLDSIGITDNDYNYYDLISYRWGNSEFNKKNYSRMNRQRISQVVDEYLPIEDTIYKDDDSSNKIFNCHELYSQESGIPDIEVYDELVDMSRQVIATRFGNAVAKFYVNGLDSYNDSNMNGFYYLVPMPKYVKDAETIYSNNNYYFEEAEFIFHDSHNKIRATKRWALFNAVNNEYSKDNAYYVADRESEYPWIGDDGLPLKYANCSEHKRFIDEYTYNEGNFHTERFVKVGLRTISPVMYFDCFRNEACNGFYYTDSGIHDFRNGKPVYYNLKGKMISFIDTSKYYKRTDPVTGYECSRFWIITDIREIVDFSDCDYFAFTTKYNEEVDPDIWDVDRSDFTKNFYEYDAGHENPNNDHAAAMVGCNIAFLQDHPEFIQKKLSKISAKYDIYKNYCRNHFNQIQLRNQPTACLICDGVEVKNAFNYNDDTKKITFNGDLHTFVKDDQGNPTGAFKLTNGAFGCDILNTNNWTLSFRCKFNDQVSIDKYIDDKSILTNKWYMITLLSSGKLYLDGKIYYNIPKIVSNTFDGVDIDIAELGVWDYELEEWYIEAISNYRILRNRPQPQKSKHSKSSNNYQPLYAVEQPRVVYDRWSTGLPENIIGGRLEEYHADKYGISHEINPLWKNNLPFDTERNFIIKGVAETIPSRIGLINEGNTLQSSSDYRAGDVVQWWWMRYKDEFRTGPIYHRPVYASLKHLVNDSYPTVKFGQNKKQDYTDIGLYFDGVNNKDNSLYDKDIISKINTNNTYNDETYDENTNFGFIKDNKVKLENYGDTYKTAEPVTSIYVPDLAQLHLSDKSIENFIFHDRLHLYNMTGFYSHLNGEWNHKTTVDSWRENDFFECYSKDDNYEAVLTYQKEIGYFWWEIRQKIDDQWKTILRTYVNPRHNQNHNMIDYDTLNYHQVDLSNQKLCKYSENDVEIFAKYCWGEIEQNVVNGCFGSNSWIRFKTIESESEYDPGIGCYYEDGFYHINFNDKWFKAEASDTYLPFEKLPDYKTPSGYLYDGIRFYVWIDYEIISDLIRTETSGKTVYKYTKKSIPGKWISIACNEVTNLNECIPYQLWKFRKTDSGSIIVNVIDSSNAEYPEETYVSLDMIDMRETFRKLIKFNGINDWKWWDHMNEEFAYLKSVNNDISCTYTSIQDTLWYMTFKKDSNGEFFKVRHSNGIIDFVTRISNEDTKLNDFKYSKVVDEVFDGVLYRNQSNV